MINWVGYSGAAQMYERQMRAECNLQKLICSDKQLERDDVVFQNALALFLKTFSYLSDAILDQMSITLMAFSHIQLKLIMSLMLEINLLQVIFMVIFFQEGEEVTEQRKIIKCEHKQRFNWAFTDENI